MLSRIALGLRNRQILRKDLNLTHFSVKIIPRYHIEATSECTDHYDAPHFAQGKFLSAALVTFAVLMGLPTRKSRAFCEADRNPSNEDNDARRTRNSNIPLSRNFVADAIDIAAPSVVNIVCLVDGYMGPVGASTGSGFVLTRDGYIVTNAHVVSSSSTGQVLITMRNGKKRKGMVHSLDTASDVALIKLGRSDNPNDDPLVPAVIGQSGTLRGGEFVIALGSPLQLQNSASLGIVSATARHASELGITNNRSEYIQTDAAINLGNSGGPLVNLDGEVIGISTMKVKESSGISFAIPIDIASIIIKQLMAHRRVIRPFVGLKMANYIPDSGTESGAGGSNSRGRAGGSSGGDGGGGWFGSGLGGNTTNRRKKRDPQDILNIHETQVIVLDVVRDSPAHKCGIVSGDIIARVDGKPVSGVRDVLDVIGLEVGKTIELQIRKAAGETVTVFLTTAPER